MQFSLAVYSFVSLRNVLAARSMLTRLVCYSTHEKSRDTPCA